MLLNCGVGEDSRESLGLQGDPTSPFWRRSALGFLLRKDAKTETPVLWPPHAKSWLIGKDSDDGGIGGRRRKGRQRMRGLVGITDSIDMSLSELRELVIDREAWGAVFRGVTKSQTGLSDWTDWTDLKKPQTAQELAGKNFCNQILEWQQNGCMAFFWLVGCEVTRGWYCYVYTLKRNQDTAPRLHYFLLIATPFSLYPSLTWLVTVLICHLELWKDQGGRMKPIFYKWETGDTERSLYLGALECPAPFPSHRTFSQNHTSDNFKRKSDLVLLYCWSWFSFV